MVRVHHGPPDRFYRHCELRFSECARVSELADELDLGSSALIGVGVQIPSLAPNAAQYLLGRWVSMLGVTHALAGAAVATMVSPRQRTAAAIVGAVSGLIADIDEPNSVLGSKIPWISTTLNLILGHRGLTHTVIFALIVACLGWGLGPLIGLTRRKCAFLTFLGVLSHVAIDSLTPMGTQALWPLPARLAGPVHTGSVPELAVTCILTVVLWMSVTRARAAGASARSRAGKER